MTVFNLGNLITAVVLLFLILYFRARDSNNRSLDEVRQFLADVRNKMEARFQAILDELEERSQDIAAQRDINIEFMRRGEESYRKFSESIAELETAQERLNKLFQSLERYEEDLGDVKKQFERVDQQTEQVHKLDAHLKEQRRWAGELKDHLMQKLVEHEGSLQKNLEQYLAGQRESFGEGVLKLQGRADELQENIEAQQEALQQVQRLRSEWDAVEGKLQADAERFNQSQQTLRDKLHNVATQNIELENKVATRQNQLQESLSQLGQNYKEMQKEVHAELERHRSEMRERISHDVQALYQGQQSVIAKETDTLVQATVEQVQVRLQEFEQWCNAHFEKFAGIESDIKKDQAVLLEHFRMEMQREIEQMEEEYREQSRKLFGDWNILAENYQNLRSDLEQIELHSREGLSKQFGLYESNFGEELKRKQEQLEGQLQEWERQSKDQLEELAQKVQREQQENWQRSKDNWENQIEAERRKLKEELRNIQQQVVEYEAESEQEIRESMSQFKQETRTQQEHIAQQNRVRDSEIRERLDEYSSELAEWSGKFLQIEKNLQERSRQVEGQYEVLETRIETDVQKMANDFETIRQQQQHVLNNSKLIERAEQLWRETREQIAKLREQGSMFSKYSEQSVHLEKEFEYIRQLAQDVGEKMRALEANEERAENLQQRVDEITRTLEQTNEKWQELQAQNTRLHEMEEHLKSIQDVYQERAKEFLVLEEQAQNLASHQTHVLQNISDMQDVQSRISAVEEVILPLEEKANELIYLQSVIEQNAGQTQEIVEQVSLLQDLLSSAQERSEELQRLRTWLVKAEDRVNEMSANLETNIHLAEQVVLQQGNTQSLSDSFTMQENRFDEETRSMVFQLAEKGWTNLSIAKHLGISEGAVELIRETRSAI